MNRIVIGIVAVSLIAGGRVLAVESGMSPASQGTPVVLQNESAVPAKNVRHQHKLDSRNKVAHVRGMSVKPRTTELFGSASGVDLPVVSPRQQSAPSQTPWSGFHIGVEGGRSSR